ncbi:MAG: hypothetical protein JSS93_14395 [Bacteroidetes bacterium]|nr:hypothetical protein [Bacteroidota bacterium]
MSPKIQFILWVFFSSTPLLWAQSVPSVTGSKLTPKEAQDALDFHNRVRHEVGSPPLQWSAELAAYAQAWANHLAESDCEMMHRPGEGKWKQLHGENIYWGSDAAQYSITDACQGWYSEIKDYHHEPISQTNFRKAGHYTQMVWKNTARVGIGKVVCKNGALIVVANYDPPGNYVGEKAY